MQKRIFAPILLSALVLSGCDIIDGDSEWQAIVQEVKNQIAVDISILPEPANYTSLALVPSSEPGTSFLEVYGVAADYYHTYNDDLVTLGFSSEEFNDDGHYYYLEAANGKFDLALFYEEETLEQAGCFVIQISKNNNVNNSILFNQAIEAAEEALDFLFNTEIPEPIGYTGDVDTFYDDEFEIFTIILEGLDEEDVYVYQEMLLNLDYEEDTYYDVEQGADYYYYVAPYGDEDEYTYAVEPYIFDIEGTYYFHIDIYLLELEEVDPPVLEYILENWEQFTLAQMANVFGLSMMAPYLPEPIGHTGLYYQNLADTLGYIQVRVTGLSSSYLDTYLEAITNIENGDGDDRSYTRKLVDGQPYYVDYDEKHQIAITYEEESLFLRASPFIGEDTPPPVLTDWQETLVFIYETIGTNVSALIEPVGYTEIDYLDYSQYGMEGIIEISFPGIASSYVSTYYAALETIGFLEIYYEDPFTELNTKALTDPSKSFIVDPYFDDCFNLQIVINEVVGDLLTWDEILNAVGVCLWQHHSDLDLLPVIDGFQSAIVLNMSMPNNWGEAQIQIYGLPSNFLSTYEAALRANGWYTPNGVGHRFAHADTSYDIEGYFDGATFILYITGVNSYI